MKRLQSPGLFPSGIGPKGPEASSAVDLASNQLNYPPALNRFLAIPSGKGLHADNGGCSKITQGILGKCNSAQTDVSSIRHAINSEAAHSKNRGKNTARIESNRVALQICVSNLDTCAGFFVAAVWLSRSSIHTRTKSPDHPHCPEADPWLYPGQGELNIWTLLPLDFNHAAINDDFGASYKTRIITCKKQNRLRKLDRLAHSLHWNDRV